MWSSVPLGTIDFQMAVLAGGGFWLVWSCGKGQLFKHYY
jgi:hypothetical protein